MAQPHTYPPTAHSTASTPITAANNPPATLTSAAPPVDVAVSAFPVDVGADGVVTLPPVAAAGVADADLKKVAITETLLLGKEVVGGGAVGHADQIEEVVLLAGEGRVSQSGDKRVIGFVA
jgi:hypothetical protein